MVAAHWDRVAADDPRTARAYVPGRELDAPGEPGITRVSAHFGHAQRAGIFDFPKRNSVPRPGGVSAARKLKRSGSRRPLRTSKDVLETQKPKVFDSPRPVEDGQRVIARPEDDKQLSVSAGEA